MKGWFVAKKVVTSVEYTDDIDGSKAEGTVSFSFDGTAYEIDLSKANSRAFEKAMALYVGHARKVRNTRPRSGRGKASAKYDLAAVRSWASENGYDVAPRGRVATEVLEAYDAAH
jgi:nucleoid-associated protein Lsr2